MTTKDMTHLIETPWMRLRPATISFVDVLTNKKKKTGRNRGFYNFSMTLKDRETSERYQVGLTFTPTSAYYFLPNAFISPSEFKEAIDPFQAYLDSLPPRKATHINSRSIDNEAVIDAERLETIKVKICEAFMPAQIDGWNKHVKANHPSINIGIGTLFLNQYEEIPA